MVKVGGQGCGVKVRVVIGGHKVGVKVGGSRSGSRSGSMSGGQRVGEGVKVRGMRVKVWGVGVRWSVGFSVGGGGEVVDK